MATESPVGPPTGGSTEGPVHQAMHRLDKEIEATHKDILGLIKDLVPVLNNEMALADLDKPTREASGCSPFAGSIDDFSHRLMLVRDEIGGIRARLEI